MKTTFIYSINCPITNNPRYIGKSNDPENRLKCHIRQRNRIRFRKSYWIINLLKNNQVPILEILDEVNVEDWEFWEQYYISLYSSWGFSLLNMTKGGATPKILWTNEMKDKQSKKRKGRKLSDETRMLMRKSKKGFIMLDSTKIKISIANTGKRWKQSENAKLKRGKRTGMLGKKHSEETKYKMSLVKKGKPGRPMTDEGKQKISIANTGKRWKHKPENLLKLKGRRSGTKGILVPEERKNKIRESVKKYQKENSFKKANTVWVEINGIKQPLLSFFRSIGQQTKATYYRNLMKDGIDITEKIKKFIPKNIIK